MTDAQTANGASSMSIFSRLLESAQGSMSADVARHILGMGFTAEDIGRMHNLAAKNQRGDISPQELEELDNYITAGDILAIWQSKARQVLMRSSAEAVEHG
jgi:hypothetical protein